MKAYAVLATPLFDRLLTKLAIQHSEIPDVFQSVIDTLKADPYNLKNQERPLFHRSDYLYTA
jgi:hypothetical protein